MFPPLKFYTRRCNFSWILLALTLLPLVFIIYELSIISAQYEPHVPTAFQVPVFPLVQWDLRPSWRDKLLRQLKLDLVEERQGNIQNKPLSCQDIDTIDMKERLGRGVTKDVYRGVYRGRSVAVKIVTDKSEDIKACWRRNKHQRKSECYVYAHYKLLKEMALTMQLNHPNIVKGLGVCIRNDTAMGSHGVITVYEIGEMTAASILRRSPWDQRLDMSIEVADLLDYMEHSPMGSLAVWDFKSSQFTIVQGRIALVDLDDVSAQELSCEKHEDCSVKVDSDTGRTDIVESGLGLVPCVNSTCRGLNAKFNVISAARGLLGRTLLSNPPPYVQHQLESILSEAGRGNMTAANLKGNLQRLMFVRPRKRKDRNKFLSKNN